MKDASYRPDPAAVRRGFERGAHRYDTAAQVQREIAARMASRLDYIKLTPQLVADLGCGTGEDVRALAHRYADARCIGFDFALAPLALARRKTPWLKRLLAPLRGGEPRFVGADLLRLPLPGGSTDLAWANLALEWVTDPALAFKEVHRVLRTGGLFMFSTLGPDTLKELRESFAATGAHVHVGRFIDMHDLGDMLVAAGFADPVMDMEMLTLTYRSVDALFADLRATGAGNVCIGRARGLTGARKWQTMRGAYERLRRDGRLPATVEVIYGHAWKPAPRVSADGRAIVNLEGLRKRR